MVILFDEQINPMIDSSSKNLIKNQDRYRIRTFTYLIRTEDRDRDRDRDMKISGDSVG
jgi:hypothetical protein